MPVASDLRLPPLRIVTIRVEPFLAEYARSVFGCGRADGAVRIPPASDLHHLVWELMAKRRRNSAPTPADGNLNIVLPSRRVCDGAAAKNPAYYNFLSAQASLLIERHLRRRFNYEFHQAVLENEESGRPRHLQDVVESFRSRHALTSITTEALLKNWQRYRRRLYPKAVRQYRKRERPRGPREAGKGAETLNVVKA